MAQLFVLQSLLLLLSLLPLMSCSRELSSVSPIKSCCSGLSNFYRVAWLSERAHYSCKFELALSDPLALA